ncbi:putative Threonine dehydrogenase-dependent dehydrogenase [Vibrio cholerae]|uniref:hypothetical protein n=2 Tax=Vibrio TaxID=662 RepID=UPI00204FA095|nr:hypothetical protein [Vibrio cholerae]EKF9802110.1 hypothetical protein [Vibrio cholerae]MDV2403609.1 hypothetical protein [Vibrio cholerae]BCN19160.1 putative monosaccharide biosynthesis protein [Vibrio cholerae]GIB07185.1 putative Threonine dehydrogenase-dependent dehydrogenase [Vibrio cholerae]
MKKINSYIYTLLDKEKLILERKTLLANENKIVADTIYSAISPGTEKAAWLGKPPLRPGKQYPRLQGYCNLAKVRWVGEEVKNICVDDYILTHQSHRSLVTVTEQEVLVKFSNLNEDDKINVCLTYLYHLGYSALIKAEYFPGHNVAIIGCGALGYTTAALLNAFGAKPTIFTDRVDTVQKIFSHTPQHIVSKSDFTVKKLKESFDIIINTSDSWDDYLIGLELLRSGGTCVLLGFPGRGEDLPHFNPLMSNLMYDKQLSIRYAGYVCESEQNMQDVRFTLKRNMKYLSSLILDGRLITSALNQLILPSDKLSDIYTILSGNNSLSLTGILKWN